MAVIFGVTGIALIWAAFAFNGWWIERQWNRRHNHPAARYMAGVQAAQPPPVDATHVEVWGRQIMAADDDTIMREATR